MNFTLHINETHMELIRREAERLNVSAAAFIKMKVLENLKFGGSE
jgi:hypothetical protein